MIAFFIFCWFLCSEVDWWSLGIVCFELLTGWPPFFDRDFEKMCEKILSKPLRFPSKYNITQPAQHVIRGLLDRDPGRRLGELLMSTSHTNTMNTRQPQPSALPSHIGNGTSSQQQPVSNNVLHNHPFFVDINWNDVSEGKLIPPYVPVTSSGGPDTRNFDREFTKLPVKESICPTLNSTTVCNNILCFAYYTILTFPCAIL